MGGGGIERTRDRDRPVPFVPERNAKPGPLGPTGHFQVKITRCAQVVRITKGRDLDLLRMRLLAMSVTFDLELQLAISIVRHGQRYCRVRICHERRRLRRSAYGHRGGGASHMHLECVDS